MSLETRILQFEVNPQLRFSKVRRRSKAPFERDWPRRPYTWEQIQEHRIRNENYGVLCGYGGLAVADADHPAIEEAIEGTLDETFSVRTGGGGLHYYYFCPDLKRRIVLTKDDRHYGEIQSVGQQVVGPGSLHPSGQRYEIATDTEIQEVPLERLHTALSEYIRTHEEIQRPKAVVPIRYPSRTDASGRELRITDVMDLTGFRKAANGELYGPNPWHGSTTGMNTWVNLEKNVAYCFRHQAGIGVVKATALSIGLIGGCDASLSRRQYSRIIEEFGVVGGES